MTYQNRQPTIIPGATHTDTRGSVSFVNGFNPYAFGVKRMYIIRNHKAGFVRAWHGHKKERKFFYVLQGAIYLGAVPIGDWALATKDHDAEISKHVLTSENPNVLSIPGGNANGFMTLTEDTIVQVFSTATLAESKKDDYRFAARRWNIWDEVDEWH
jgi:dTDP-4-dehydrorhamnose 3,5-epimerase